jgi:hypothetical protein
VRRSTALAIVASVKAAWLGQSAMLDQERNAMLARETLRG